MMMVFKDGKSGDRVPRRITADFVAEIPKISTLTGEIGPMEPEDQKLRMMKKEVKTSLRLQLNKYVKEKTFRQAKFNMTVQQERAVCIKAVAEGKVNLPAGVEDTVFAEVFQKEVRKRIKEVRNNCAHSAKMKFVGK